MIYSLNCSLGIASCKPYFCIIICSRFAGEMRKFVENLQTPRVRKENGEIGRNPEEAQRVLPPLRAHIRSEHLFRPQRCLLTESSFAFRKL